MKARTVSLVILAACCLPAGASSQSTEIIYYPFLTNTGTSVLNLAAGGPKNGTVMSTTASPWVAGKTSFALAGASVSTPTTYNYVDTGWQANLKDDFTCAWFMKEANAPGTLAAYLLSGIGSFRLFTGGVANNGLYLRTWGGAPADLVLPTSTNLKGLAQSAWVHVAIVVDWTVSKTAVWYIDGKPVTVIPITAGASLTSTTNLRVGAHTSLTTAWPYHTDEFRFYNRAASPGEVAAWSALTPAGDGPYNVATACGAKLGSNNGPPSLGNAAYQLAVQGSASSPFALSVGFKRGLLAFDLGLINAAMTGCKWDSSLDLLGAGVTNASGAGVVALPIPNLPGLAGANLWSQSVVLVNWQGTNGFNSYLN